MALLLRIILAIFFSFFILPHPITKSYGFKCWNMCHLYSLLSSCTITILPQVNVIFFIDYCIGKWSPCFPSWYLLRSPSPKGKFLLLYVYRVPIFFIKSFPITFLHTCNLIILFVNYKMFVFTTGLYASWKQGLWLFIGGFLIPGI